MLTDIDYFSSGGVSAMTAPDLLNNPYKKPVEEITVERDRYEATLQAVVGWLITNQPDVFKRGLLTAIKNAQRAGT